MVKSFFEKKDLKALTALGLYSGALTAKEEDGNNLSIVFVTNFGFVKAKKILTKSFDDETITSENYLRFLFQNAVKSTSDLVEEYNNGEIYQTQTSFLLEEVTIKPHSSSTETNLPFMILFAQDIVGLSIST